jgi:cell wall-associated NlpC family hydrolase
MKILVFALGLLAWLPGESYGQGAIFSVQLPLGPLSVRATLEDGDVLIRASPRSRDRRAGHAVEGGGSAAAARVLASGHRYVGTRYRYGGETPWEGFDCSGFVQYVFGRHAIDLPRTSREQATAGRAVPLGLASLQPGDLMLFASSGGRVDHVAIYAGKGRILHSSAGRGGVGYDDLASSRGEWFMARHVATRRVV